jgi:hypothetical protein
MDGEVHYIYVNPKFCSETDAELGKVVKKRKVNPTGENVFLHADGSLERGRRQDHSRPAHLQARILQAGR